MLIETTKELRQLTGNYFANNDFSKIEMDIALATEELAKVVGRAVISRAERKDPEDADLLIKVQHPVALLATLRMYQKNDLSHEDDGRKMKTATDGSEKTPWEWQLDRDDALHLEEYYRATDALIRYLDEKKIAEWLDTPTARERAALMIRSAEQFDRYFPIDKSERTYLLLVPFIREAQRQTVQRAYGAQWPDLLAESAVPESDAHYAASMAVALLAVSTAIRRLPLNLIPGGVIRGYRNANGMQTSQPASLDEVQRTADWMTEDARLWVEQMKQARDGSTLDVELLPKNDRHNKYCRL